MCQKRRVDLIILGVSLRLEHLMEYAESLRKSVPDKTLQHPVWKLREEDNLKNMQNKKNIGCIFRVESCKVSNIPAAQLPL